MPAMRKDYPESGMKPTPPAAVPVDLGPCCEVRLVFHDNLLARLDHGSAISYSLGIREPA